MTSHGRVQSGFTLIELLIAIVITSVVFVGLASSLTSIFSITEGSAQRTKLNDLAYANMRLYADGNKPTWFSCNVSNQTAPITLINETGEVEGFPVDVTQTVTVTAVYGCDGSKKGYPLLVESTATLSNGRSSSHATYTSY